MCYHGFVSRHYFRDRVNSIISSVCMLIVAFFGDYFSFVIRLSALIFLWWLDVAPVYEQFLCCSIYFITFYYVFTVLSVTV